MPADLLSLFVSTAHAADAPAAAPQGGLLSFLPLIIIFVLFYFLIIRPQTKRAKEHRDMVAKLAVGDEVVTQGGVLGRVSEVEDAFVKIEIANNVQVRVQRHAIGAVMPKGTYK